MNVSSLLIVLAIILAAVSTFAYPLSLHAAVLLLGVAALLRTGER